MPHHLRLLQPVPMPHHLRLLQPSTNATSPAGNHVATSTTGCCNQCHITSGCCNQCHITSGCCTTTNATSPQAAATNATSTQAAATQHQCHINSGCCTTTNATSTQAAATSTNATSTQAAATTTNATSTQAAATSTNATSPEAAATSTNASTPESAASRWTSTQAVQPCHITYSFDRNATSPTGYMQQCHIDLQAAAPIHQLTADCQPMPHQLRLLQQCHITSGCQPPPMQQPEAATTQCTHPRLLQPASMQHLQKHVDSVIVQLMQNLGYQHR